MRIIDDEYALPAPEPQRWTTFSFIRSLCDPLFIIDARNGDTFTRRDGKRWQYPGYKVTRESKRPEHVDREPATAPEDSAIYKD